MYVLLLLLCSVSWKNVPSRGTGEAAFETSLGVCCLVLLLLLLVAQRTGQYYFWLFNFLIYTIFFGACLRVEPVH